jgi:hypothetical protein
MILDVVTSVPNDAISIAVAETLLTDDIERISSSDDKNNCLRRNRKKGKVGKRENNKIICNEPEPSRNHKETNEHKTTSMEKQYPTSLLGENIIDPFSPATKVNSSGLNKVDLIRKECSLKPKNIKNILTALRPILDKEINNLQLVNHIPKPDNLNMTQLVDCFATSHMTILQHQTKDTILECLNSSSIPLDFHEKGMDFVSEQLSNKRPIANTIQNASNCVPRQNISNLQIETKLGNSIALDETANHSPPRCTKTTSKMSVLPLFEMFWRGTQLNAFCIGLAVGCLLSNCAETKSISFSWKCEEEFKHSRIVSFVCCCKIVICDVEKQSTNCVMLRLSGLGI